MSEAAARLGYAEPTDKEREAQRVFVSGKDIFVSLYATHTMIIINAKTLFLGVILINAHQKCNHCIAPLRQVLLTRPFLDVFVVLLHLVTLNSFLKIVSYLERKIFSHPHGTYIYLLLV